MRVVCTNNLLKSVLLNMVDRKNQYGCIPLFIQTWHFLAKYSILYWTFVLHIHKLQHINIYLFQLLFQLQHSNYYIACCRPWFVECLTTYSDSFISIASYAKLSWNLFVTHIIHLVIYKIEMWVFNTNICMWNIYWAV